MSNKTYGILLIVVGVLIVAVVFLAVPLHLGGAGFGLKKIAGAVVGVIALAAGIILTIGKKTK
ncbi:MAG: hypothetical protein ABSA01_12775 [Anaerolineales bacterium]|jgi:hypothetical protein